MSKYDELSNNVQELVMALAQTDSELSNRIEDLKRRLGGWVDALDKATREAFEATDEELEDVKERLDKLGHDVEVLVDTSTNLRVTNLETRLEQLELRHDEEAADAGDLEVLEERVLKLEQDRSASSNTTDTQDYWSAKTFSTKSPLAETIPITLTDLSGFRDPTVQDYVQQLKDEIATWRHDAGEFRKEAAEGQEIIDQLRGEVDNMDEVYDKIVSVISEVNPDDNEDQTLVDRMKEAVVHAQATENELVQQKVRQLEDKNAKLTEDVEALDAAYDEVAEVVRAVDPDGNQEKSLAERVWSALAKCAEDRTKDLQKAAEAHAENFRALSETNWQLWGQIKEQYAYIQQLEGMTPSRPNLRDGDGDLG